MNGTPRTILAILSLIFCTAALQSDDGPGWGHLIFNEETNPLKAVPDSEVERGKSMAVLVSPKDNRDWDHRGNSNLAHVSIFEYASGGEALLVAGEGKVETLLIVAGGTADIQIGSFKSDVVKEDVIFVPSGLSFAAKVTGAEP
jgi:mannose-6-phosphate isomerase-like protein (cupin superfamily)